MESYTFRVNDVREIDLDRILEEQRDQGILVSLVVNQGQEKYLLIHNEFLEGFCVEDNVDVCGKNLCPTWGGRDVVVQQSGRDFCLRPAYEEKLLQCGRFSKTAGTVEEIRDRLNRARAFVRTIKVTVISL